MSKFFNETQKVSQAAQKNFANDDLDIKQMLDAVKQNAASGGAGLADVRLRRCRKVEIAGGKDNARLVLQQHDYAQLALEAYRGLRTKLMRVQADLGLRAIAITSSQPGEGKTLTTMNLGLCCSQLPEQRVLLIDADLRTRGLTRLLDQPDTESLGLTDILKDTAKADEAIVSTEQKNLFILPAGSISMPAPEHFTGSRWREFLGWCSETFKVILVDTPPIMAPLADFELINAACDGILLVARAHVGQREALQKTVATLDPKKLLGVIFNAADFAAKDSYGYGYR
jgi:capsular exopolysaccharide synthesis family protein